MADDAETEAKPEGWHVPQRLPMIAAALVPLVLLLLLLGAGRLYDTHIRPGHYRPVTTFPAPGIETYIHDGQGDPPRPLPSAKPDPAIDAAKRQIVRDGIGGWR